MDGNEKHFTYICCNEGKKRSNGDDNDDNGQKLLIPQVNEVCDFIRGLPGCADYAEDFAIQEIDGQALMLLKEDHLMSAMSIKLGPALKIVAKIDSMRVDSNSNPSSNSS